MHAQRTQSEQSLASNVVFALSGKLVQQTSMVNQFVAGNLRNRTRVVRVNQANIALSSNKQTRVSTAQLGDTHQLAKAHAQSATRTVSRTGDGGTVEYPEPGPSRYSRGDFLEGRTPRRGGHLFSKEGRSPESEAR